MCLKLQVILPLLNDCFLENIKIIIVSMAFFESVVLILLIIKLGNCCYNENRCCVVYKQL